MITTKEERNEIRKIDNKVLKKVLTKESKEAMDNLKLSKDFADIRFYQGFISATEDILKLIS